MLSALRVKLFVMAKVFERSLIERQPTATAFFGSAIGEDRLHHAYIFTGGDMSDKWLVTRRITQYLNCAREQKATTGSCFTNAIEPEEACQNCRWIEESKHPQAWFELKDSESVSGIISVERARQVSEELAKTSNYRRAVIVEDGSQDVFHRPAANALLKTIEEPRARSLFFLFARSIEQVLATIVSRCQVVPFRRDGNEMMGPFALLSQGQKDLISRAVSCRGAQNAPSPEVMNKLKSFKQKPFFEWSRRYSAAHAGKPKARAEGELAIAVSEALELAKQMNDLIDDEIEAEVVIDSAVLTELEIIGTRALADPTFSSYLSRLFTLQEQAKTQIDRYVSRKAAVDSFVLDWDELRNNFIV